MGGNHPAYIFKTLTRNKMTPITKRTMDAMEMLDVLNKHIAWCENEGKKAVVNGLSYKEGRSAQLAKLRAEISRAKWRIYFIENTTDFNFSTHRCDYDVNV